LFSLTVVNHLIELKWGQGAKNIGGEIKIDNLDSAIKYASDADIDLLTIDGAGGGTGMSP